MSSGNSPDDDEYDDIISLYDDIDEHAVNPYEGLEKSVSSPVAQPQATNNYATLGAVEWDDTSKSSENIEMSELYADPDAVSQLLSNTSTLSSLHIRRHVSAGWFFDFHSTAFRRAFDYSKVTKFTVT